MRRENIVKTPENPASLNDLGRPPSPLLSSFVHLLGSHFSLEFVGQALAKSTRGIWLVSNLLRSKMSDIGVL